MLEAASELVNTPVGRAWKDQVNLNMAAFVEVFPAAAMSMAKQPFGFPLPFILACLPCLFGQRCRGIELCVEIGVCLAKRPLVLIYPGWRILRAVISGRVIP